MGKSEQLVPGYQEWARIGRLSGAWAISWPISWPVDPQTAFFDGPYEKDDPPMVYAYPPTRIP